MVRQRLAPQHPFPAALLDVLIAYLALLAPPAHSAPHASIPASRIVLAADSSGACLALGLLQVLLRLQRRGVTVVRSSGRAVTLALPAGAALTSPVTELTNGLDSYDRNAAFDIFPQPPEKLPYLEPHFPTCALWPADPLRANLYCEARLLPHPLASPVANADWRGCCPLWLASGQEQTVDGARLLAQTAIAQGVLVTLREFEALPHTFFWYLRHAPQTHRLLNEWAAAIAAFAAGRAPASSAAFVRARDLALEPLDVARLVPLTVAQARVIMDRKAQQYRVPVHHRQTKATL